MFILDLKIDFESRTKKNVKCHGDGWVKDFQFYELGEKNMKMAFRQNCIHTIHVSWCGKAEGK